MSGEDHGVASVAGVTRTRGAEEETPTMVTGKQFVKGGNTKYKFSSNNLRSTCDLVMICQERGHEAADAGGPRDQTQSAE